MKRHYFKIIFVLLLFSGCLVLRRKAVSKAIAGTQFPEKFFIETHFRNDEGLMIVKAILENDTLPTELIFDTGSQCTFSFATKEKYKIKARKFSSVPGNRIQYGKLNLQFGDIKYKDLTGVYLNHPAMAGYPGIIGSNALHKGIWEINFHDSTIKGSTDRSQFKNIEGAYVADFIPSEGQQTPIVKIYFGGDSIEAFFDTGAWGFVRLNEDFNRKAKGCEHSVSASKAGSKMFLYDWYRCPTLRLGNLQLDSVCVRPEHGYRGKNCLGYSFMSRYIVTIDWLEKKVYFKPFKFVHGERNKQVFSYGGVFLYLDKDDVKIAHIFRNSPAEGDGLKPGDIVITINGKTAKQAFLETPKVYIANNNSSPTLYLTIKDKGTFSLQKQQVFESYKAK